MYKNYKVMVLREGWFLVKVAHGNVQESLQRSGLKRRMASCEGGTQKCTGKLTKSGHKRGMTSCEDST